jgi:predicted GIY-YIG superfamily endonuclease
MYLEPQPSRRVAMQRERSLKSLPRQLKQALIDEQQDALQTFDVNRENDVQNQENPMDHG